MAASVISASPPTGSSAAQFAGSDSAANSSAPTATTAGSAAATQPQASSKPMSTSQKRIEKDARPETSQRPGPRRTPLTCTDASRRPRQRIDALTRKSISNLNTGSVSNSASKPSAASIVKQI